jgi:hypothetical protein
MGHNYRLTSTHVLGVLSSMTIAHAYGSAHVKVSSVDAGKAIGARLLERGRLNFLLGKS